MNFLDYASERIIRNKINKGFPIGDYKYDLKKLREEIDELEKALDENNADAVAEESAGVMIMTLGIVRQYDKTINPQRSISAKMYKNEHRIITKVSDHQFTKSEGLE